MYESGRGKLSLDFFQWLLLAFSWTWRSRSVGIQLSVQQCVIWWSPGGLLRFHNVSYKYFFYHIYRCQLQSLWQGSHVHCPPRQIECQMKPSPCTREKDARHCTSMSCRKLLLLLLHQSPAWYRLWGSTNTRFLCFSNLHIVWWSSWWRRIQCSY